VQFYNSSRLVPIPVVLGCVGIGGIIVDVSVVGVIVARNDIKQAVSKP
jgi:hypothetical protein